MALQSLAFLTSLLLFAAAFFQTGGRPAAGVYGPYHGHFIPAGVGLKKELPPEAAALKAEGRWSIHGWVKSDGPLSAALLAGFGDPAGEPGAQRYLAVRGGKFSFRSGEAEVGTQALLRPGTWQHLAATFDGSTLRLYVDGAEAASRGMRFAGAAAPVVHLAPVPPAGSDATHFAGKIAGFTLAPRALSAGEARSLSARPRGLDSLPFEAGSKTWPVQVKGQSGLRAPQDAWAVPPPPQVFAPRARPSSQTAPRLDPRGANEWALAGGWRMIEAPKTNAGGAALSRPGFKADGWLDATVPGTVLTTLVDRGVYPDPDFGLNNLAIPEALNKQDYWYRVEFHPPASLAGRRLVIKLHGINYAASVWLNGRPLGDLRGAFMRGAFDATGLVVPGRPNALALRISPPPHPGIPHEQSIEAGPGPNGGLMCLDGPTFFCTEGWDWIPGVRDRATGIWQEVTLKATGPVAIGDPHVVTDLPLPDTSRASVRITVPLGNESKRSVAGLLEASFEGVRIARRVVVPPGGASVSLKPSDFPQLNLSDPRLWWPNGYGSPELYHLTLRFTAGGAESDVKSLRFGVRELSYELTLLDGAGRLRRGDFNALAATDAGRHVVNVSHEGMVESAAGWVASFMPGAESSPAFRALDDPRAWSHLALRVNGVRIAVRGGNWGLDDSRKRISRERMEPYFRLHREANLNMVRNWSGQNYSEVFFDLADEYGLLVWSDFWLSTQDWNLEPTDTALFLANARDTVLRFRNHPSLAIWCGRNEGVPPPAINEGLDELIRALDGTRYYSPNSREVNLQGSGPWHYREAVKYFTTARGFSTELGLPSVPRADVLRGMLAASDPWPPDDAWAYHDWHAKGGGDVNHFMKAMEEELGAPAGLEDFERKSQLLNYVSHRAMFEGFNAQLWRPNTGRLMWMTHPAWPSTSWQMYASDYSTDGAYYGVKKACEPLHVQLNLPGLEAAVVNLTREARPNLTLSARALRVRGEELFAREMKISAPANSTSEGFRLELPGGDGRDVALVKLSLGDEAGRTLSENFYWHAPRPAGYRALNDLPAADIVLSAVRRDAGGGAAGAVRVEVGLTNRGTSAALALQAILRDAGTGARLLPAYASDNFV
jgi:beta-galactosidase/beta-glucuronidase